MVDRKRELPDFQPGPTAGQFAEVMALLRGMHPFAAELAAYRRDMYLAYLEAGFTEDQALGLAARALP